MNANYYELNKLNPLQSKRDLKLTTEEKAVIHQKAKAAKRPDKSVDYLTVPALALTELPALYAAKYTGTCGHHAKRLELYRLFLHIVYTTHRTNLESQEDFFPLYSQILKNLMGSNGAQVNYTAIRADLKAWDYLEYTDDYAFNSRADLAAKMVKETYCKGYRLSERIRNGNFVSHRAKGIKFAEKTEKSMQGLTSALLVSISQPQYARLKASLARMSMNPAAYQWITHQQLVQAPLKDKEVRIGKEWKKLTNRTVTKEVADAYRGSVDEIINRFADGNPFFKVNNTNKRLESGVTNLTTGLRQFIEVVGVSGPLKYIDLSSSQVYLSLKLLQHTNAVKNSNGTDFAKFKELALGGNFYNDLAAELKSTYGYQVAGDPKVNYFKFVHYSTEHKAFGYRKCFNQLFPVINEAILELVANAKDKQEGLAILLQKEEASVFLDKICLRLYNALDPEKFVGTIHDGIICEAEDFDVVYNVMLEVLTKHTGFPPHLKVSNFNSTQVQPIQHMITKANWLTAVLTNEVTLEKVVEIFIVTEVELAAEQHAVQSLFSDWLTPLPVTDWRKEFIAELEREYIHYKAA